MTLGGRSSSVKVETAANIWESVFYTIGFYLKSFSDLNLALKIIKENSLLQLYKRGRKLVEIQFYKAKQLFTTIQGNCPVINNYAYNATIEKGIPLFFATYDLNFAAHETPGSIDYPVSNDQMELVGIEYISGYLKKLFWENRFCQKFSRKSCLFGAEFDAFFRVLGDMELALLQQRVPPEIMDPSLRFTERGQEWQHRLAAFLQSLAPTRKEKIGKICTQLRQTKPN